MAEEPKNIPQVYSPKVLEHFRNPQHFGRMENPDGVGKVGNEVCGDIMFTSMTVFCCPLLERLMNLGGLLEWGFLSFCMLG